jgi:hypothetical protein
MAALPLNELGQIRQQLQQQQPLVEAAAMGGEGLGEGPPEPATSGVTPGITRSYNQGELGEGSSAAEGPTCGQGNEKTI